MDIIYSQLMPFRGMDYFVDYFNNVRLVELKDRQIAKKFALCFAILFLQILYFFYQYFFFLFTKMSPFQQILHGDYAGVSNINPELYLFCCAVCVNCMYYFFVAYFPHGDNGVLKLIQTVLIDGKVDFFGESLYRGVHVIAYLRKFSLLVLNGFLGFIFIVDLFALTTQIVSMKNLFEYDPNIYKSVKGLALILFMEARLLLLDVVLCLYAHTHILTAILWVIALEIFGIKLNQLRRQPSNWQQKYISVYLSQLRLEIIRTLRVLLNANQLFSKMIVVFLVVNCPLNCLLVSCMLKGKITPDKLPFVGAVAMEGIICAFGMHLFIAIVNKRIHAPSKMFIRLNLLNNNKGSQLKYKIKLDNFIFAFHTRKKYGFTYYPAGLISMVAFVKYVLLYSELLMYYLKN